MSASPGKWVSLKSPSARQTLAVRLELKLVAVAALATGLVGCVASTNEERAQDYIYREYGPEYNVLACGADGLFDDKGTVVGCTVENVDTNREWDITVEFDGDGGDVLHVEGMPG